MGNNQSKIAGRKTDSQCLSSSQPNTLESSANKDNKSSKPNTLQKPNDNDNKAILPSGTEISSNQNTEEPTVPHSLNPEISKGNASLAYFLKTAQEVLDASNENLNRHSTDLGITGTSTDSDRATDQQASGIKTQSSTNSGHEGVGAQTKGDLSLEESNRLGRTEFEVKPILNTRRLKRVRFDESSIISAKNKNVADVDIDDNNNNAYNSRPTKRSRKVEKMPASNSKEDSRDLLREERIHQEREEEEEDGGEGGEGGMKSASASNLDTHRSTDDSISGAPIINSAPIPSTSPAMATDLMPMPTPHGNYNDFLTQNNLGQAYSIETDVTYPHFSRHYKDTRNGHQLISPPRLNIDSASSFNLAKPRPYTSPYLQADLRGVVTDATATLINSTQRKKTTGYSDKLSPFNIANPPPYVSPYPPTTMQGVVADATSRLMDLSRQREEMHHRFPGGENFWRSGTLENLQDLAERECRGLLFGNGSEVGNSGAHGGSDSNRLVDNGALSYKGQGGGTSTRVLAPSMASDGVTQLGQNMMGAHGNSENGHSGHNRRRSAQSQSSNPILSINENLDSDQLDEGIADAVDPDISMAVDSNICTAVNLDISAAVNPDISTVATNNAISSKGKRKRRKIN